MSGNKSKNSYVAISLATKSATPISEGVAAYVADPQFKIEILSAYVEGGAPILLFKDNLIKDFLLGLLMDKNLKIVVNNVFFVFPILKKVLNLSDKRFFKFIDILLLSKFGGGPGKFSELKNFWNLTNNYEDTRDLTEALLIPYKERVTPVEVRGEFVNLMGVKNNFFENDTLKAILGTSLNLNTTYLMEAYEKINEIYGRLYSDSLNRRNAFLHYLRNEKGIRFDKVLCKKIYDNMVKTYELFHEKAKGLTGLNDFNLDSSIHFINFIYQKTGYRLPSTRAKDLNPFLKEEKDKTILQLANLRQNRPSGILIKKLEHILEMKGDLLKGSIEFFSALTGRYKGFGVGPLNFPRSKGNFDAIIDELDNNTLIKRNKEKSFEVLKGMMRKTLIPNTHDRFFGFDFSSIEFRLLMSVAGEDKVIEKINSGWDCYKWIASKIYKKSIDDVTDEERYISKRVVLSRGYGLGPKALKQQLNAENLFLNEKDCNKMTDIYDKTFPKVKRFWDLSFKPFYKEGLVHIKIPYINQYLFFHKVKRHGKHFHFEHPKKGQDSIYPSKLTGLIVQSLALRLLHFTERTLYEKMRLVADVPLHDEFIVSVEPYHDFEKFKKVVSISPEWLPKKHFPSLKIEAWKGRRYLK